MSEKELLHHLSTVMFAALISGTIAAGCFDGGYWFSGGFFAALFLITGAITVKGLAAYLRGDFEGSDND